MFLSHGNISKEWTIEKDEKFCLHFNSNNRNQLLKIIADFSIPTQKHKPIDQLNSCSICKDLITNRKYFCLECSFVGCIEQRHFQNHSTTHFLFFNPLNQTIFCSHCNLLFPVFNLKRDSKVQIFQLKPKGLNNLGNTCFLSSVLQIFLNNSNILRLFGDGRDVSIACNKRRSFNGFGSKSSSNSTLCMSCDFDSLFIQYCSPNQRSLNPSCMLQSLWSSSETLAGYEQQDAHEFLISFLNDLHFHFSSKLQQSTAIPNSQLVDGMRERGFQSILTNSQLFPTDKCSCPIHQDWSGLLQSVVCCTTCGKDSVTEESFFDISLDTHLSSGQLSGTLNDLLDKFTSPEQLHSGQYFCAQCGSYSGECWKKMNFATLPTLFTVHIKRFSKQEFKLQVPIELDLSVYCCSHNSNSLYSLYAVICYVGNMESGHYYCILRHAELGWVCIDDSVVKPIGINLPIELISNAYLLFYQRKGSRSS